MNKPSIIFVSSTGGHLSEMLELKDMFNKYDYHIITEKTKSNTPLIDKYPDIVNVYKIGDVSLEICGGPHVKNTSELGHFKIKKEEASSAGVRRIKAILE